MKNLEVTQLPYTLIKGSYPLPTSTSVACRYAVKHHGSNNIGVLVQHTSTGLYSLFCAGKTCSVPQKEAAEIAAKALEDDGRSKYSPTETRKEEDAMGTNKAMKAWIIHEGCGGCGWSIYGSTLIDAIENNFNRICRHSGVGNAVGWHLNRVHMQYEEGILGGRGGVVLFINATGLELANGRKPEHPKQTTVWIYADRADCPSPYEFEFNDNERGRAKSDESRYDMER